MTDITLSLAPIARSDLPQLLAWRNDYRIWAWTRQNDLLNEVEHAEWFERQAKCPSTRMYKVMGTIADKTQAVGVCGLTSLDHANRRAEFSLYIAPSYHRRGLGKVALNLLFRHGFSNLGLNVIWGETFDGNPAAKMFEALGMKKEGTRRAFYWKDGRFVDAHLYSLLREEFDDGHALGLRGAADPGDLGDGDGAQLGGDSRGDGQDCGGEGGTSGSSPQRGGAIIAQADFQEAHVVGQ